MERNIKVLYLLHSTRFSGGAISLINMLSGVKLRGVDVVVVCQRGVDLLFRKTIEELGVRIIESHVPCEIYPVNIFFRNYLSYPWRFLKLLAEIYKGDSALKKIISEEKPDVIHSNYGVVHQGYRVAKQLGIPHVWHVREYQDRDFNFRFFPTKRSYINALNEGSYVVTITKDLLSYFSLEQNQRAQCVYNGIYSKKEIQDSMSRHGNVSHKDKSFICVSRVSASKGYDDVIDAFARFHPLHPDWKLEILGKADLPSYQEHLIKKCQALGIADNVVWHGFKKDVKEYISRAKALIVASYNEGFGRMTAEASMLGTIPIGRNSAGTREIIVNSGGLLFDDVESLVDRMNDIVDMSEDEYQRLTADIQSRSLDLYSIESNVEKILEIYRTIAK